MNKALKFGCLLGISTLLPLTAQAAETNSITARVGSLGYGVEYGLGLSPTTQVRIGANGGAYSSGGNDGGVDYDYDWNLRSGDLLLDWFPFSGVFYTSIGALYNKNKLEAKAKTGSVTVGANTYNSPDLKGEVTFKTFSPYLGIGFGSNPTSKGFAFMMDIGVVYQGSPKVKLTSSSGVSQADLDREAAEMEAALKDYKYYPHIGFSFGARF